MLVREIESVLSLPPDEAVARLLSLPEGQWFDRKSARTNPVGLAPALVAMANAEGGYIAIGFSAGSVEPMTPRRINEFRQAAQFTEPPVRITPSEIPVAGSGAVLVLRVEPGRHVHTTAAGDAYLRIGDISKKLGYAQRQQLELDKEPAVFEGLPVPRKLPALNQGALAEYQRTIGSSTIEGMLRARDLLTEGEEPTVAAWLLFADRPQSLYPEAYVRVLRYTGTVRGVGRDLQLYDHGDVRLEGSIPEQIRQAEKIIDQWIPKRRALRDDGRFGPIPLIPADAWLEGLVNAVIHRSYAWAGDHIRVEIFLDRIEITSPGGLAGPGDHRRPLDIKRYARNPRIARVCAELGIAQELGEGIQRMFSVMRQANLDDPIYRVEDNQIRLTLYASRLPSEATGLSATATRIVDVLRQADQPLGTGQVASLASISAITANKHLKQLRDGGLVEWEGTSPRDPQATWRLK
ncbi:MAG: putative DNA binding domain-containing protein [Propionibacteriaceae bacterium]|nr:putative DNA binding domain-containing protein [Propionibacteriaceae bacterium]